MNIKILRNILWLYTDKAIRLGLGLAVTIILARKLGPDSFGMINFSISVVAIISAIAGLGLQAIVVRDLIKDPNKDGEILGSAFLLHFMSGIVTFSIAVIFIYFFQSESQELSKIAIILCSPVLFQFLALSQCWYEAKTNLKHIVIIQISIFIAFSTLKIILLIFDYGVIAIAWTLALETTFTHLSNFLVLFIKNKEIKNKLSVKSIIAKPLIKDSWPLLFSSLAALLYMKIDQIMLGEMISIDTVGIYSAAVKLSEIWYFIPIAIVSSYFPSILQERIRNRKLYLDRLQFLYDFLTLISIAISIFIFFFAKEIIVLIFGSEFEHASDVLIVHIWGSVFVFLGIAGGKWYVAENLAKLTLRRTLIGAIINVVLNFILIPKHGMLGAAYATLIAQVFSAFILDAFDPRTRHTFKMKLSSLYLHKSIYRLIKSREQIN